MINISDEQLEILVKFLNEPVISQELRECLSKLDITSPASSSDTTASSTSPQESSSAADPGERKDSGTA